LFGGGDRGKGVMTVAESGAVWVVVHGGGVTITAPGGRLAPVVVAAPKGQVRVHVAWGRGVGGWVGRELRV
jgi:hypothetical protein